MTVKQSGLSKMKCNRLLKLGLTLFALLSVRAASPPSGVVLDQQQLSAPLYLAQFDTVNLAQSFQPATTNIAGAGIQLFPNHGTGTGTVTISLYDKLPNQGGTLLASGTASGAAGQFVDVFWTPVACKPNSTYYLVFTCSNTTLAVAGDTNNPYPSGQAYADSGYQSYPQFDYTFRTYTNTLLINGGFETGDFTGWNIDLSNPAPVVTSSISHSGIYSALLGTVSGPEANGDSRFSQLTSVLPTGATLTFWYLREQAIKSLTIGRMCTSKTQSEITWQLFSMSAAIRKHGRKRPIICRFMRGSKCA